MVHAHQLQCNHRVQVLANYQQRLNLWIGDNQQNGNSAVLLGYGHRQVQPNRKRSRKNDWDNDLPNRQEIILIPVMIYQFLVGS